MTEIVSSKNISPSLFDYFSKCLPKLSVLVGKLLSVADSKNENGGWRKTTYQPRRLSSQAHTTNYIPFARVKLAFKRIFLSQQRGGKGAPKPSTH